MTQTALLIETTIAIMAGPLVGVVIAGRQASKAAGGRTGRLGGPWGTVAITAGAALGFTAVCLAANALTGHGLATSLSAAPHVTLGAAFLAACAIGVACGAWFDDVLDAALCSLAIAGCASFGIFVLGPTAARTPTAVVDAALTLSPISATASAADLDIFRSEPLYQLSPLAHTQLVYPAWTTATLVYFIIALAFLAGASRTPHMDGLSTDTRAMLKGWNL